MTYWISGGFLDPSKLMGGRLRPPSVAVYSMFRKSSWRPSTRRPSWRQTLTRPDLLTPWRWHSSRKWTTNSPSWCRFAQPEWRSIQRAFGRRSVMQIWGCWTSCLHRFVQVCHWQEFDSWGDREVFGVVPCRKLDLCSKKLQNIRESISGWWFGTFLYVSIYWECHDPNWPIFFRGVGEKLPTR